MNKGNSESVLEEFESRITNGGIMLINKKTGKKATIPESKKYMKAQHKAQCVQKNLAKNKREREKLELAEAKRSKAYTDYRRECYKYRDMVHNKLKGASQFRITDWITENVNQNTNKIRCTYKDIQNHVKTSRNNIHSCLSRLKSTGLFKIHSSVIFVSPLLEIRGSSIKYLRIYRDYYYTSQSWWKHVNTNDEFTPKEI